MSSEPSPRRAGSLPLVTCLRELARNLWWTWQPEVLGLFRELDPAAWRQLDHNPIALLAGAPAGARSSAAPPSWRCTAGSTTPTASWREYLESQTDLGRHRTPASCAPGPVAYFSAEFGLHESLPIYSGGLGVLAGDHLKSASDLGMPLVAIGLFYDQGYFRQRLDAERLAAGGVPRRSTSTSCRSTAVLGGRRQAGR